ncbi:nucleoside hydrolase [Streptomyces sp. NRRL F-4489]|uniref:nucleoside hydrolase n=1 Tax=Streptomyces sp. NRRL F-4489 TaxID=1609095 RepID=UPI00074A5EE9|nr:nucleoside hydrolase [Streptomyces sp. NRRL F-4489]KUL38479.1 nucleoside hydrolase [Streptomyces sp. NRRL F-4489]
MPATRPTPPSASPSSATARPLLMDCDTGIDDAVALLYLCLTPGVELRAVTTVAGNTSAERAARNTLQVLEVAGRTDIPVAAGAGATLRGETRPEAAFVHGEGGLGGVALPAPTAALDPRHAADLIIDTARAAGGDLEILATAPLTNLALALRKEPRLPELVRRVTVMGGAVHHPGNISPVAEANIGNDPEAAALVLAAGWDLTLVPLDVTMRENLTEAHRQRLLAAGSPVARLAGEILDFYFAFHEETALPFRGSALHDPLAAGIAAGEVVPVSAPRLSVTVDTAEGAARGALVADTRGMYLGYPAQPGANATVVLETDRTFPELLVDRLCRGAGRDA